jgi:hypothetical protein
VNEAAASLKAVYGDEIPFKSIQREAERIGNYRRGSIIPSDYCYNLINKAPDSFRHPVLILIGPDVYKYVGPGYTDYTGPVKWRSRGGPEQIVGHWNDGRLTLKFDPRRSSRYKVS